MATIKSQLILNDGMTQPIRHISNAMNALIGEFQEMQSLAGRPIGTQNFEYMRQEIAQANVELDRFQANQNETGRGTDALTSKFMRLGAAIGAAFSVRQVIGLSDTMTQTEARLNLITGDLEKTKLLQDQIMASANRARASYVDTANAVSRFGINARDAFNNTDEIIAFTEAVNKSFTISGASAQEQSAAMIQLTQAMASGVLRGEELNSIYEQAPRIIQTISKQMDIPMSKMREMASEGKLTAEVVKNAMIGAFGDINNEFNSMNYTWGQVWNLMFNTFMQVFQPILNVIGSGAQFIAEHLETVKMALYGVAAGIAVFAVATLFANGAVSGFIVTLQTLAWTMVATPAFWLALMIGVLVMIVYKCIQAVGGLTNAWNLVKQAAVIAGIYIQLIWFQTANVVLTVIEKIDYGIQAAGIAIADFMGSLYSTVMMGLQNVINGAIGLINKFINLLNKLPGVSIEAISEVTFGTTAKLQHEANKQSRASYLSGLKSTYANNQADREANIASLKSQLSTETDNIKAMFNKYTSEAQKGQNTTLEGLFADATASGINAALPGAAGNLGSVADSAGSVASAMETTEEDLKYLRDIAEREAINRFTTAEVKIDMTGMTNEISSDMDLDGVISRFTNGFREALNVAAEGVHV